MNTPNPLHPQGAFLETRGRSQVRIAVFTILAIHVVLLGALLLQGCKRTTEPPTEITNVPPVEPPPIQPPVIQPPPVPIVPVTPPATQAVVTPPPVTPPIVEPPPSAGAEHVVVKGDTFGKLAKQYKTTIKAIVEANPGVDSTRLKIGQKLRIPGATPAPAAPAAALGGTEEKTYTVKSGDNLLRIAKTHGVTVKQLRSANNLKTDQIKVGQKLKIPAAASAPAAPPPPSVETVQPPALPVPPPAPTSNP